ncbi:SMU1112c/YaeR family gloxylase I-like metalloprotein [Proteus vulgaris]|uniref:SMU1112c/YaeR family gloxylase I-like metalloprotein n=1 Tax=Proteus vulgaris TaxID=585 RepID=UPI0006597EA8|nr:VOC family protein [Proteus vulgaris]CRL59156.1 putative lyase [Proteus vulgaris]
MLKLNKIHHVAIICVDYKVSKHFYCNILGLTLLKENYREVMQSWKAELAFGDNYQIELFSFPAPPPRLNYPEACGLRHLAFSVDNVEESIQYLQQHGITYEPIRIDPSSHKQFTFFQDPDGLPLELYCA